LFRMKSEDVPALRRRPGSLAEGSAPLPQGLLRYSDEQTIAGTAAVFAAIKVMGLPPERFENWGLVAASRFLGRANLAQALRSFAAEGVWGISPHLIPHFALHSPSGTISLALGLHGPNLGVGGGLYAAAEGFLAALTWLAAGVVPGVWLVLSGWTPELIPEPRNGATWPGECRALALAIAASGAHEGRFSIRVVSGAGTRLAPATLDLVGLFDRLGQPGTTRFPTIATDPTGQLRIELVPRTKESPGMNHARHG
jgi:hypothetical protein